MTCAALDHLAHALAADRCDVPLVVAAAKVLEQHGGWRFPLVTSAGAIIATLDTERRHHQMVLGQHGADLAALS